MRYTRLLTTALALMLSSGVAAAFPLFGAGAPPPTRYDGYRPLTIDELYGLYANRTWVWKDGAGHFDYHARRFVGWTREGGKPATAEGTWFLTDAGRMCFRATWTTAQGGKEALTCFDHVRNGGTVYQRRSPDGKWYVFSSTPSKRGDEIRKLKPGNLVSRRLSR